MPAKVDLDLLLRDATETAALRGHRIGKARYARADFKRATASCDDCGMEIHVIREPAPNEIEISGQAVALECPKGSPDES
jgi:hypothetical protein